VRPNKTTGRFRWTSDLLHLLTYALLKSRNGGFLGSRQNPFMTSRPRTDQNTTDDQLRLMLQSLLVDRLKMVVHRETKGGNRLFSDGGQEWPENTGGQRRAKDLPSRSGYANPPMDWRERWWSYDS
jgi:hypothetical protein